MQPGGAIAVASASGISGCCSSKLARGRIWTIAPALTTTPLTSWAIAWSDLTRRTTDAELGGGRVWMRIEACCASEGVDAR